ncbi:SUZ RNA-binding domain-containing isoform X2 [Anabrus simplex]|uniref:SUZ RNA-binding domain-containing isoform X2 n=1 Tax=Anabrus simplex TaxID=316456 RepID=UPI0035A2DDB7
MAATEQAAIVENWEDIEDSATFDTKLLLGSPSSPDDYEPVRTSSLLSSRNGNNGPITFRDDVGNIYLPPEPTVKILKRPKKCADGNEGGHLLNGDAKPRHPIKTLQQREQEYAEARLRILGEARSPEEQLPVATDDRISKIQTKLELLRASDAANVVRLPKGPDGSRGFNLQR